MDCLIDCTEISCFCYHGDTQRNEGNWEIGMVIHERIRTCYLGFNHAPVSTVCLVLEGD